MTLKVPDARELDILTAFLTPALSIKIYGNDRTPAAGDTASLYNEIAGGDYAAKALLIANWTISMGAPTVALGPLQTWAFTGVINAPGTIYGYFIVETVSGLLKWAERFPAANVPFVPIAGSSVKVTPRITCQG